MKPINLRDTRKHCIDCEEIVEVRMEGLDGYCPECGLKLYSVDTRQEKQK